MGKLIPFGEMIGRVAHTGQSFWRTVRRRQKTVDETQTDYEFWDKLRRGKQAGFEISGLFAKPITEILAGGILGRGVSATIDSDQRGADVEYTNDLLARFLRRSMGQLVTLVEDLLALGDQFVIINEDGSLTIPSPDTVDVIYSITDYRQMEAVRVTTVLDKVTITDTYRREARDLVIHYHDPQVPDEEYSFPNTLGRIPVVHFANDRSANETHGRPVYEALYTLLSRYNDLMMKGLDGAEIMGNPIPVFEGMEDVDAVFDYNEVDTEETLDNEGNPVERVRLAFDRLMAVVLGKGGSFKFAAPPQGFTTDIRDMLKSLFLLVLEFTRIPEAVWGGELGSARATAEQQMIPFYQYLEKRRLMIAGRGRDEVLGVEARGGLLEVLDIWLMTRAQSDPQVAVAPVVMEWPDLFESAEEMRFQWVQWMKSLDLITDESAVRASRMFEDAAAEVEAAREEAPDDIGMDDYDLRLADLERAQADTPLEDEAA